MTVVVAMDRFFAVSRPLHSRTKLTLKRAQVKTAIVSVASIIYNIPRLFEQRIIALSIEEYLVVEKNFLKCAKETFHIERNGSSSEDFFARLISIVPEEKASFFAKWREPYVGIYPWLEDVEIFQWIYQVILFSLLVQVGPIILLFFFNIRLVFILRKSRQQRIILGCGPHQVPMRRFKSNQSENGTASTFTQIGPTHSQTDQFIKNTITCASKEAQKDTEKNKRVQLNSKNSHERNSSRAKGSLHAEDIVIITVITVFLVTETPGAVYQVLYSLGRKETLIFTTWFQYFSIGSKLLTSTCIAKYLT